MGLIKVAKRIVIIRKVRHIINRKTLVNLYYTFIFPYLSYCNIVWDRAANVYLSRIFLLQKKFCAVYITLDTGSILHHCLWKVRL